MFDSYQQGLIAGLIVGILFAGALVYSMVKIDEKHIYECIDLCDLNGKLKEVSHDQCFCKSGVTIYIKGK